MKYILSFMCILHFRSFLPLYFFNSYSIFVRLLLNFLPRGRLSYHLCFECFSQLSFDSEKYTKSANIRHKDDRMNSLYKFRYFARRYLERPIRLPRQPKVLHIAQAQVEFHVCERAGTEKINKVYLLKIVFRIYKTFPIYMSHEKPVLIYDH